MKKKEKKTFIKGILDIGSIYKSY